MQIRSNQSLDNKANHQQWIITQRDIHSFSLPSRRLICSCSANKANHSRDNRQITGRNSHEQKLYLQTYVICWTFWCVTWTEISQERWTLHRHNETQQISIRICKTNALNQCKSMGTFFKISSAEGRKDMKNFFIFCASVLLSTVSLSIRCKIYKKV